MPLRDEKRRFDRRVSFVATDRSCLPGLPAGENLADIGTQLDLSDRTVNRIVGKIAEARRSSGLVA